MENDIIKGSDGRSYKRGRDGRLTEQPDPAGHAKRQLEGITADHTITGIRLSLATDPAAPATIVTLSRAEAVSVVKAVQKVLAARAAEAAPAGSA